MSQEILGEGKLCGQGASLYRTREGACALGAKIEVAAVTCQREGR